MSEPKKVTLTLDHLRLVIQDYFQQAAGTQKGFLITDDATLLDVVRKTAEAGHN